MPYRHINAAERQVIQRGLEAGESLRSIARSLGRSHSSLSRERRRNGGQAAYEATAAHYLRKAVPVSRDTIGALVMRT